MAQYRTQLLEVAGRKYYLIEHDKHSHLIWLDSDIDSDGNGSTSGFVATDARNIFHTHEHPIEDFEIVPFSNPAQWRHEHTNPSPQRLRNEKAREDTAADAPSTGGIAALGDMGVVAPDAITGTDDPDVMTPEGLTTDEEGRTFLDTEGIVIGGGLSEDLITSADIVDLSRFDDIIDGQVSSTAPGTRVRLFPANAIYTGNVPVDWPKRTEHEPYYNIEEELYAATVTTDYLPTEEQIPERIILQGIKQLTDFYAKEMPADIRVNNMRIETEYELTERPNEGNKILVTIPAAVFDLFRDKRPCFETGGRARRNTSTYADLIKQVNTVAAGCDKYHKQCIKVPGINLRHEAIRLRKFLNKINKLMRDNKIVIDPDRQNEVEIGYNTNREITYVSVDSQTACVGLTAFLFTDPVDNPRTSGYLYDLPKLANRLSSIRQPTLTEFITEMTHPPCPKFKPSSFADELPGLAQKFGFRAFPDSADPLDIINWTSDTIEASDPQNLYTTAEKLLEENNAIVDPNFSRQQALKAESTFHYAGDDVVYNIPLLLEQLVTNGSLDEIFSEVLNKIDMSTIAGFAASAVMGKIPNLKDILECANETYYNGAEKVLKTFVEAARADIASFRERETDASGNTTLAARGVETDAGDLVTEFEIEMKRILAFARVDAEKILIELCYLVNQEYPIASEDNVSRETLTYLTNLNVDIDSDMEEVQQAEQEGLRTVFSTPRPRVMEEEIINERTPGTGLRTADLTSNSSWLSGLGGFERDVISTNTLILTGLDFYFAFTERIIDLYTNVHGSFFGSAKVLSLGTRQDAFHRLRVNRNKYLAALKVAELICDPKNPIPDLSGFRVPSLPRLPDLSTFDFMGWLTAELLQALLDFAASMFSSLLAEIMKSVVNFSGLDPVSICTCLDPSFNINISTNLDFGGFDVDDVFNTILGIPLPENEDVFNFSMGEILEAFVCTPVGFEEKGGIGAELRMFLNDVSSSLTSSEMLALMEGKVTGNTHAIIKSIIRQEKYVKLVGYFSSSFGNEASVRDFFFHVGGYLGPNSLEEQRQGSLEGSEGAVFTSDKRQFLMDRKFGDSLTQDKIQEELSKITCRETSAATRMLQNNDTSSLDLPQPKILGTKTGLLSPTPGSVQYMIERTIETMFDGINITFEQVLHGPSGFIQSACFKSGSRRYYETLKEQDSARQRSALYTGIGPAPAPFEWHNWSPFEIRDGAAGDALHIGERNDGLLEPIKTYLEDLSFPAQPIQRDSQGRPQGNISFSLPTQREDLSWEFKGLNENRVFEYILKVPTPNFRPYQSDSIIQITTKQDIDLSKYNAKGSDVPVILNDISPETNNPVAIFAAIATQDFKENLPDIDSSKISEYIEKVGYYRTMADILKLFTDEILDSKILNATTEEVMNWRLEPVTDVSGHTQTTLLGLEELREKAKKRYEEFVPGPKDDSTAAMQNTVIASATEATIRLHVIEIFLRTLPVFDTFRKNDIIGDEFVGYISKKIQESCVRQDPFYPGYYENILDSAKELYRLEWKNNNNSLNDPSTGDTMPGPKRIQSEDSLRYFIKKTILDMSEEITKLNMLSQKRKTSIYKSLLNNMIRFPNKTNGIFDVPTKLGALLPKDIPPPGDNRYVYLDRFEEIPNISRVQEKGRELEEEYGTEPHYVGFNKLRAGLETFEDGGLLLEKYVQYEVPPTAQRGQPLPDPEVYIVPVSEYVEIPANAEKIRFGLRLVYVPEIDSELRSQVGRQVVEASGLLKQHEQAFIPDPIEPPGKRSAVSLDPDDTDTDISLGLGSGDTAVTQQQAENRARRRQTYHVYDKPDQFRAFRIMERFENVKIVDERGPTNSSTGERDGAFAKENFYTYRWIYPMPLVSVVTDEEFDIDREPPDFQPYLNKLINKMVEDDRFKILFEHCFPLQKILSVMTIYTEVVFSNSGDQKLITVFDQIKDMLKSLLDGGRNMNNYSYRDRTIQAVGGNAGLYKGRKRRVFSGGRQPVLYDNQTNSFTYPGKFHKGEN